MSICFANRPVRRARLFFITALALLALAAPAQAAFPGRNGQIAYASAHDGCLDAINPDGTGERTVACNPTPDDTPAWSPDGKVIASVLGSTTIATVNGDGTQNKPIYDAGTVAGTGWSPDGSKIVFSVFDVCSVCSEVADIWTLNPDGTGATDVTNTPNFDERDPDWSPDGTKIAFAGRPWTQAGGFGDSDIYTMKADGTGIVDLTNTPNSFESEPSWSPDGQKIAFQRGNDIWTMNADGSGQTNLTNSAAPTVNANPAWSPDGTKIAFDSNRDAGAGGFPQDIYAMNADGSNVRRVTTSPQTSEGNFGPDWQPVLRNYARPRGATPTVVSLSPAYKPCDSPNTTHSAPLAFPSCNPPERTSRFLTVGTPDFNGQGARSIGSVRFDVALGPPEDGVINLSITDVRCSQGTSTGCGGGALSPYTGALGFHTTFRITDKSNGGANPSGTVTDVPLSFSVPCAPAGAGVGATCSVATTINTIVGSSAITPGKRAIWEFGGDMKLFDGGSAGVAGAADATLFADGGLFFP